MFTRPRGTRDYLPADCRKRRFVTEQFRRVFELYGYGEIITPAFEHLELLEAKAGSEVKEQIYWFKDKSGRALGLRFELTTSIARVVASNPVMPKPIRFYYIQPVWRYEEPQRGRLREFWQAGIELLGVDNHLADAEVVAVTHRALSAAGLKNIRVCVNSRKIAEHVVQSLGIPSSKWEEAFRAIDKLKRLGEEYVRNRLRELGADDGKLLEVLSMLGTPLAPEDAVERLTSVLGEKGKNAVTRLQLTLEMLEEGYGIKYPDVVVDLSIVRGLAYYTDFVFEVEVRGSGEMRGLSVAGGGRYDDLIQSVGGPPIPATGMAIGVERVIEALELQGAFKDDAYTPAKAVVIPVGQELCSEATRVAEELRKAGIPTVVELTARSLRSSLESAYRNGIPYAVIVGKREANTGVYTLKALKEWREEKLPLHELITRILEA